MPQPRALTSAQSHEDLFIQHYDQLLAWALQLSEGDRSQAKDLVQDAYVQFTLHRRDLNSIDNLEGSLYGLLRHLHLSHLRRAARPSAGTQSLIAFESAELGLRAVDLRAQMQVQDELRLICRY